MATIHDNPETTEISLTDDFLVADILQPNGQYKTRKIRPGNLGLGGSGIGFTPENVANKTNDVTLAADSPTLYPTEHAVKAYVDAGLASVGSPLGYTPENIANKTNDTTLAASSATLYPTENAVKVYVDGAVAGKQNALGFTPENVANKTTDGTLAANSDTLYPSEKAVKTYVDTGLALKQALLGFTPENVVNKDTDITLSANSDTRYASQKAVKAYIDGRTPGENEVRDGWSVEFFGDYAVGTPTLNKGIGWDGDGAGSGLSVVSRNIYTGKSENRLVINGGQYGRKLYIGSFWNRIQIGIMFRVTGSSSFSGDGYVGLCSGTTNMVASGTTDNFIGIRWATDSNSWAFSAGTLVNKYTQSVGTRFSTRRGFATTDQGGGAGSDGRTFSASEGFRSMLFLEISRPVFALDADAITYSMGMRSTSSSQVEMSLSKRSFVDCMLDGVSSTLAAMVTGAVTIGAGPVTNSFTFDQSTGAFDTVNISWPNVTQLMEISAIAVRKVY